MLISPNIFDDFAPECESGLMIVAILATLIRLSIGALNLGLQRSTALKKPGEEDQRGNLR